MPLDISGTPALPTPAQGEKLQFQRPETIMANTSPEVEAWMAGILKKAIEKGIDLPEVKTGEPRGGP